MHIPPEILNAIGLALDIFGVFFLFLFAPEKYPDPQTLAFFAIEDDSREKWKKDQEKRKWIARWCIFFIIFGFALQLAAEIMKLLVWN